MLLFVMTFLLVGGATVQATNILAIIPFPSYSNQLPLMTVSKALAARGYNLTVITSAPPKEPIKNFTVIDVSLLFEQSTTKLTPGNIFETNYMDFFVYAAFGNVYMSLCDKQLSLPSIKGFIRDAKNTKFDLVIMPNAFFSNYFGLIHKIGFPPVVAISTMTRLSIADWIMGVPVNPAYIPDQISKYSDEMAFFERVYNTLIYWWLKIYIVSLYFPWQDELMQKHFGTGLPSVQEMEFNKSLVLITSDQTMDYPVPQPPNVISIGPLHVSPPKALPQDLQKWMDEAQDGVVYVSFGSNQKFAKFQVEIQEAFLKAFAQFPNVRFLCKWETDDKLPGATDNILTRKWFPQQDILGHPKMKAVIFQGGTQSAQEVIHHGVPMIGIPLFGDQKRTLRKLSGEGAAVVIQPRDLTSKTIFDSLLKVFSDKSYKENAMRLSRLTRDRITSGMDEAVWWMEYVMRHKGAKHLRPASLKLNWFQLNLLDVYLFLFSVMLIVAYSVYLVIKLVVGKVRGDSKKYKKVKTK